MNATFHLPERTPTDAQLAHANLRLRVGVHVIDIGALRLVSRPDAPRLTSKAVAVLIELIRHAGDTVTRDQLLDSVWRNRVTTQDVLTQAIKELRRAFADDAKPSQYIETIPKVGYRLIAPVTIVSSADAALAILPTGIDEAANTHWPPDDVLAAPLTDVARPRLRLHVLSALVFIAALGFLAVYFATRASQRSAPTSADIWKVEDARSITSDPGPERRPRLAPDGTRFAYVKFERDQARSRIYLRGVHPSQVTTLTAHADGFEATPTWSPDGSEIAFARLGYNTCRLMIAPSTGGSEREVASCQDYATNYFDWSPDGKRLITAERVGGSGGDLTLINLDIATGAKTPFEYAHAANDQDLEAHYSPDGKWISFRRGVAPYSDLYVMTPDGKNVRALTHIASRIYGYSWTPDSRGLIFSTIVSGQTALYTVSLEDTAMRPLGVSPGQYPSIARGSDTVLYEIPRVTDALTELSIDSNVKPIKRAASTGSDGTPAISLDGSKIAFVSDRSGSQQLWLYDRASDSAAPLTEFDKGLLLNPKWSPDARHLLVTHRQPGKSDLIEIDLATRRQRVVNRADENILSATYGPDEDSVLLTAGASSPEDHLIVVRHAGKADESRQTLLAAVAHVEFDPAGNWIYYTKTAQRGLFRRALDGGDEQFVTPLVTSILIDGWRVTGGKIWYVRDMEFNPTDIREFDPVSGQDRSVGKFPIELSDLNFSVDGSRQHIVVAPIAGDDTDVGAFRIIRG